MKLGLEVMEQPQNVVLPTHDIKLFSGRSNTVLAQEIADDLGTTVEHTIIRNVYDGEIYVQIQDSIRGDDVFVVKHG